MKGWKKDLEEAIKMSEGEIKTRQKPDKKEEWGDINKM